MAEVYSIGVFRVFRDVERSRMDSEEWQRNHEDAVRFTWTTIFIHAGLPKEIAIQRADEELQKLREKYCQEGTHGSHTYEKSRAIPDRE